MLGTAQSALEPVMTAVYGLLSASAAFMALSPILNDVPQGTAMPYTVLGNPTEVPWNTMHEYGKEITLQLHVVSQAQGDQQALRILNAARGVLDYAKFAVAGHTLVDCKYESGDHWKDEAVNGVLTRHHVQIYRIRVAQPA